MNRNRLAAWFRDRKAEIGQALMAARSEPSTSQSPEWYTGLVVSPTSFSRQLSDMQLSLQRANGSMPRPAPGGSQASEPAALGSQRI